MRTRLVHLAACLVVSSSLALAQAPGGKPKPGPGHRRLEYFVGKWTSVADVKASPFGPGGRMENQDTCEWFEGGFAVVCRSEGKGPMGPTKAIGILGYNAELKVYTYYAIDNGPMDMTTVPRGTVQGDTWVYNDQSRMGGRMVTSRYTIKQSSATSYTYKWETLGEDGAWQTLIEGTSTKTS